MSEAPPKTLATADILKILELLPHRYPFLMVDRIIDIDGDNAGIGIKNVTFNEPQFLGHFPVAGVPRRAADRGHGPDRRRHVRGGDGGSRPPKVVYFMTIDKVKFRKPVEPGDVVHYHLTKLKQRSNMWWYRGEAKVDGKTVAEAEVSAMLVRD